MNPRPSISQGRAYLGDRHSAWVPPPRPPRLTWCSSPGSHPSSRGQSPPQTAPYPSSPTTCHIIHRQGDDDQYHEMAPHRECWLAWAHIITPLSHQLSGGLDSLDHGFDLGGGLVRGGPIEDLLLGLEGGVEVVVGGGGVGLGGDDDGSLGQVEGKLHVVRQPERTQRGDTEEPQARK